MFRIVGSRNREVWLDIARGICIICMITVHAFDWSKCNFWFSEIAGTWFLVFFFFSSGLCFKEKSSLKFYALHQFKKLIIPYLVVVFSYLLWRLYWGIWGGATVIEKIGCFIASVLFALPIDINNIYSLDVSSIGIGPIWFFVCLFFSSIIYYILHMTIKNGTVRIFVCFFLAFVASISQHYFVLPLCIQNSFIGNMFIAFGVMLKKYIVSFVNYLKRSNWIIVILFCVIIAAIHVFLLDLLPFQVLNMGANVYYITSLVSSFTGIAFCISLAVAIEKSKLIDEFLSFCGRETLLIVVFHSIDILIIRNWAMRDYSFLLGTILLYPFIIHVYRRLKVNLKMIHSS